MRKNLAEDVVGGAAVRLPQRIEPRQVCRLRDADIGGGGVDLFKRRANGRIVIERVLDGLIEREDGRWRRALRRRGDRRGQHKKQRARDGPDQLQPLAHLLYRKPYTHFVVMANTSVGTLTVFPMRFSQEWR